MFNQSKKTVAIILLPTKQLKFAQNHKQSVLGFNRHFQKKKSLLMETKKFDDDV